MSRRIALCLICAGIVPAAIGWLIYDHHTTVSNWNETVQASGIKARTEMHLTAFGVFGITKVLECKVEKGDADDIYIVSGKLSIDHGAKVVPFSTTYDNSRGEYTAIYMDGEKVDYEAETKARLAEMADKRNEINEGD